MTPGFARPRAELPYLYYPRNDRVIINAHNFTPPVFNPAVNGKSPVITWCPSRDTVGNGTTTLYDLAGTNNGTLTSMDAATDWVADTGSGGVRRLDFDGINDRVIAASASLQFIQNSFVYSISFWIKVLNTSGRYSLTGNAAGTSDKGFCVLFENGAGVGTKAIRVFVNYGSAGNNSQAFRSSDNAITDTNWHHVVITSSAAATRQIYVDGASLTVTGETQTAVAATGVSTRAVAIGVCNHSALFLPSFSSQDDFRVWNATLDSSDVAFLYNSGAGRGRSS